MVKKSYFNKKIGKYMYVCPVCKKLEPEWYVSGKEWRKLPKKYSANKGNTLCKSCFKKLSKTKKIKLLTLNEIMMGGIQ